MVVGNTSSLMLLVVAAMDLMYGVLRAVISTNTKATLTLKVSVAQGKETVGTDLYNSHRWYCNNK